MHHSSRIVAFAVLASTCHLCAQSPTQFAQQDLFGRTNTFSLQAIDFDGDGILDIVQGAATEVLVTSFAGSSRQSVLAIPSPTAGAFADAGDIDGDGDVDVLLAATFGTPIGQQAWLRNEGASTFAMQPLPLAQGFVVGARLLDVDGDGDLDIVRKLLFGFEVFINGGRGSFALGVGVLPGGVAVAPAYSILAADVNGDGAADIINIGSTQAQLLLSQPGGRYALRSFPSGGTGTPIPTVGAFADFDGDGDVDVALTDTSGTITVYIGDGNGNFASLPATATTRALVAVAALDADLDGDVDLVGVDGGIAQTNGAYLWLNDGQGNLLEATGTRMPVGGGTARYVVAGDFDGDGDEDVAVADRQIGIPAAAPTRLLRNRHVHLAVTATVVAGGTLNLELGSQPGYLAGIDVALPFVGAPSRVRAQWAGIELGVDPIGAVALPFVALSGRAGLGNLAVPVPSDPGLVGLDFAIQALLLDPLGSRPARVTGFERFAVR